MNAFVGPPLGGLLVAVSVPVALGGSVLGYGLAAIGLALIVGSFKPSSDRPRQAITTEIRNGFDFLWHDRVLRSMAIMVAISNTGNTAVWAVFVLFAVAPGPMALNELGYGLLITALAIGGIIGSLVEERVERRLGRSNVMFLAVAVAGITYLVPVFTAEPAIIVAAMVTQGTTFMMWNVVTVSLRQRMTPDHLLGRVNATYRLFAWGAMPVGAVLGGVVAELLGLRWVFALAAVSSLAMLAFRRFLRDADLDAAEVAHPVPVTRTAPSS
jgi:predicted MFS family arabinose efflux permease